MQSRLSLYVYYEYSRLKYEYEYSRFSPVGVHNQVRKHKIVILVHSMHLDFVTSLAAFFEVETILRCARIDFSDTDMDMWASFATADQFYFDLLLLDDLTTEPTISPQMDMNALVYLDGEECLSVATPDLISERPDIVWVINTDMIKVVVPDYLRYDTKWIVASNTLSNGLIELFEHYAVLGKNKFAKRLGTWSPQEGLQVSKQDIWTRRQDLEGVTLTNAYIPLAPAIRRDKSSQKWVGYLPEILHAVQSRMNFTVRHYMPKSNEVGARRVHENGTEYWSGLMGELLSNRADVTFTGIIINEERARLVDFTMGVITPLLTIVVGTNMLPGSHINAMAFIDILTLEIWLAMLLISLLHAFCYYYHSGPGRFNGSRDKRSSVVYGLVSVGSIFLQLEVNIGKWMANKVLYLSIFIACFFVLECYKAQLTADMTVLTPQAKLKSFQDILDNDMTVIVVRGSASDRYLTSAPKGTARHEINKRKSVRLDSFSGPVMDQLVEDLNRDPKLAYFGPDVPFFVRHTDRVKILTDFHEMIEATVGIALPKNSELTAAINYHLLKTKESGLFEQEHHVWMNGRRTEDMSHRIFESGVFALGVDNLFFPMNVMAGGILAASAIYVLECMNKKALGC